MRNMRAGLALVIVTGVLITGWQLWPAIQPHLDGLLTDRPNTRVERAVDDEVERIYMSMNVPGEEIDVIFCAPRQIGPDGDLSEIFADPKYNPDYFKELLETYYRKDHSHISERLIIVSFDSYAQVQSMTWNVSGVDQWAYFRCPGTHYVFHQVRTTRALPYATIEAQVRAREKATERKTGSGGLFGIFGVGHEEAEVLFCRPVLLKIIGDLDAVLRNPDFRDSLEQGYRDLHPNGASHLFTVVDISRDAEIAGQTLRGEPLHMDELYVGRRSLFNCGNTHKEYHRMKVEYNDPSAR